MDTLLLWVQMRSRLLLALAFPILGAISISYFSKNIELEAEKKAKDDELFIKYELKGKSQVAIFRGFNAFCADYAIKNNNFLYIDDERVFIYELENIKVVRSNINSIVRCSYGIGSTYKPN